METQAIKLVGKNLYLRPVGIQDVTQEYYEWLNDPIINSGLAKDKYLFDEIIEYVRIKSSDPNCYFFAIVLKENDKMIGTIKLDNYDPNAKNMELGILIGDLENHGKGYGFESCQLMIDFAFNELQLNKVWLAVYENNLNALHLYKKLGFVIEGKQRKHILKKGILIDKYLMGKNYLSIIPNDTLYYPSPNGIFSLARQGLKAHR